MELKSKTLQNYYGKVPDEYSLTFQHFSVILDNDSKEEYQLLEYDINNIRKYNKDNSIIYFADTNNLNKVLQNTNILDNTSDICLRIRNEEEYKEYQKLNIKVNIVIELKDVESINIEDDRIILQIDNVLELSVDKLKLLSKKYNITKILLGQIQYITKEHKYLLTILSKEFNIDESNQRDLEINNQVTNDIYDLETYIKILNKLEYIIKINKKDYVLDTIREIFYYLANNIEYDDEGINKTNVNSQNLIGPLFNNLAVCEGYSKVFKQLLSLLNIESIIICGGGHIWNQVCIDNKWYNADVTTQHYYIGENIDKDVFLTKDSESNFIPSSPFAHKCNDNYYKKGINYER